MCLINDIQYHNIISFQKLAHNCSMNYNMGINKSNMLRGPLISCAEQINFILQGNKSFQRIMGVNKLQSLIYST